MPEAAGVPPEVSVWAGDVSHTRLFPTKHAFRYPLHLFMVDTKAVDSGSAFSGWGLLAGTSKWCAVSLQREDFLKGVGVDDLPLDEAVRTLVRRTTGDDAAATGPVRLMAHPRYFGYTFNPAAFFYLYKPGPGPHPALECVVVQVTNTPWSEMHCYVLHPAAPGVTVVRHDEESVRYRWPKTFHVSPFMPMKHEYDWTFDVPALADGPGSELTMSSKQVRVPADAHPAPAPQPPVPAVGDDEDDGSGAAVGSTVFTTAMRLTGSRPTVASILYRLLVLPWLTVLVQIWIHWEALRLVAKGVALFPHPTGATTAATRTVEAIASPVMACLAWVKGLRGGGGAAGTDGGKPGGGRQAKTSAAGSAGGRQSSGGGRARRAKAGKAGRQ